MTFLWPQLLWLLLAVPALVAGYFYMLNRRRAAAAKYASLSMLREAAESGASYRRHVPPVLFLLALVAMLLAIARPAAVVTLPSQHQTVILAMDVSGSMRATDVEPNRLVAAQAAARTFIDEQPRSTRIGVVAFAATALVVQHPTQKREDVLAAIERLQLQRGTAIGSGIIISLSAIFPDEGITLESVSQANDLRRRPPAAPSPFDPQPDKGKTPAKPVPPGSFNSAAIVLLTDGQRTTGPDALEAARVAADRGVRVYTVGIGTPDGEIMGFEGWRMRVKLDEETLKNVAGITQGQYFYAGNASDLKKVYQGLNSRFVMEKKETEVTAFFSGFAALLAAVSALLSLLWFNRVF
jgi:Ca-activated chloride channel family protein